MFSPVSPRALGANPSVQTALGEPKAVTHVVPCEMLAVQYADEHGQTHATVLLRAGGTWYMPPNAEQWAGSLRTLSPWLSKACEAQYQSRQPSVPKEDVEDTFKRPEVA